MREIEKEVSSRRTETASEELPMDVRQGSNFTSWWVFTHEHTGKETLGTGWTY